MKKSISYIITIVIGFILFLSTALALDEKYVKGTFKYYQSVTGELIESNYYYSDSYFSKSGELEDEHLRTFAATLAFASDTDKKEEHLNEHLLDIFKDLKFESISTYDYDDIYSKDTIGVTIANKKIDDKSIVAVVIRGEGYEDEWASNFSVGSTGDAEGFSSSSNKVIDRLLEYIKNNNINNPKFLVTGYSRGGAISNLVGVYLNEHLDELNVSRDDIYVYTFDGANSSINTNIYNNIHNVVNKNDLVTYLYPNAWGLRLNGNIEDITDYSRTITTKYLNIFDFPNIRDYEEVQISEFMNNYINLLFDNDLVTRENYDNIESSFSYLFYFYMNKSDEQINKLNNYLTNKIIDYVYKDGDFNYFNAISLINMFTYKEPDKIKDSYDYFMDYLKEDINEIADVISEDEFIVFKEEFYKFFITIHSSFREDFINTIFEDNSNVLYHHLSFIGNIDNLLIEHYPNNVLSLVQSKDSFYTLEPTILKGNITVDGVLIDEYEALKYNFNDEDILKVNNGFDIDISTKIEVLKESEVSLEDKVLINKLLGENDIISNYFDINILKTTGYNIDKIEELASPIKVYLEVKDYNPSLQYKIIRIHDGKAEIINFNKVTRDGKNYFEFESDKFSTYALVKTKSNEVNIYYYGSLILILILDVIFIYFYNKKRKK